MSWSVTKINQSYVNAFINKSNKVEKESLKIINTWYLIWGI